MNQLIKKSNAIIYVIIGIALLVFLAIWPAGIIHQTYVSKSDEKVAMESDAVNVEHNLTQMFVAEDDYLSAVDLYVTNEMQGETITFRLYDASYLELYNIFYVVPSGTKIPGFVHIPVGYETVKDQEYYYTIEGLSTDLYVNLEDNAESTSIVNGILAYAGEEFPGYNIIMRYEYTNSFPWYLVLLSAVLLGAVAFGIITLVKMLYRKKFTDKEITVQRLLQFLGNPVILAVALILLYLVFPGRTFGTGVLNYAFYDFGILIITVFLLYVLNSRRTDSCVFCTVAIIQNHLPDVLQSVCFAGALWSCYEYWNGLYDIYHAYATCKMLCWFFLAIITTYKKKELLNLVNLIYLIASVVGAYLYAKPYIGIEEQGKLHKLQAYVIVIGGFVIVNSIRIIADMIRKRNFVKPELPYSVAVMILFVGLIVFRNNKIWPILTAVMLVLLILRMCVWENRDRFSHNLCNGILFNFIFAIGYCLLHRPYHAFIYYRYGMMFHTVTVTAEYLTLIMGASMIQYFARYKKYRESDETSFLAYMWKELLLFGAASVYMLLTLSRTGFMAAAAMFVVMLIVVMTISFAHDLRNNMKHIVLAMFVTVLLCFPVIFTGTRVFPALRNDPVRSEVEETEVSIRKGDAKDSVNYMSLQRFLNVAGIKLLHNNTEESAETLEVWPTGSIYASADNQQEISVSMNQPQEVTDGQEDTQADFSNGRIELFEDYRKEWNLTGHEEMGVVMKDGETSVHAHNSFLQAIHDFGIPTGIYLILFGAFTFMCSVNLFRKTWKVDMYSILTAVIVVGFCAAGMAEWMFHICNPMGFALFMCIIPVLFSQNGIKE